MVLGAHHRSAGRARSLEAELLLAAARPYPGPNDVRRAHAAMSHGAAFDWDRFVPIARHHGVLPLLYRHLSSDTFDLRLVPERARAWLREEAENTGRLNLMLAAELVSLLRMLEREGLRVVSLKGPILAQQLYGSVALRRIGDLDLLVNEEHAERATALIARRGYEVEAS